MGDLPRDTDTVVIGAGQAGLTMSWYLRAAGREHVLLDRRAAIGGGWQDRWDAFRLVSPNWTVGFPDASYDGGDPDGFMTRDELLSRIRDYARAIDAPVEPGVDVSRLTPLPGAGLRLTTSRGTITARQVIVATGGFHAPLIPHVAATLSPRVMSLHSHDYRSPGQLPEGGVLVVGSGQSGVQLAEELADAGRDVWLSVGSAGRVPRRYRGRDIFAWLAALANEGEALGMGLPTVDKLPHPSRRLAGNPHLSGHKGGHDTNLRQMGLDGVRLVGRITACDGERVTLGDTLIADLDAADRFFAERFRDAVDGYIAARGLDAPAADPERPVPYDPPARTEIDLRRERVSTVLWTSGYRRDYSWIDAPVADEWGFPIQDRGVSDIPGLAFIGSHWLHDQVSSTIFGLPRDARILAERLSLVPASVA